MEPQLPTTSSFDSLPESRRPCLGFRVEYHENRTLFDGNMAPRDRSAHILRKQFPRILDTHLSWTLEHTPFISFFNSWERAMRWRKWLLEKKGATSVVIIAVWLKDELAVYDAYKIAIALGYARHSLDRRRRLEHHEGEFLVHGGISADNYRILACFEGNTASNHQILLRPFPSALITYCATIPADSLPNDGNENRTEELRSEMYSLIGARNDMKFCALVLAMCCCNWELEQRGHTFTIQAFSWPSVNFRFST